jgi:hypothetical protein
MQQPVRTPNPSQVVLDIVVRWSETLGDHGDSDHGAPSSPVLDGDWTRGTAKVMKEAGGSLLLLFTRNHLRRPISLSLPVHFDGDPIAGTQPRFILWRLGPHVWKLAPSVATPVLHAYVTIVDVPEPPPWEKKEGSDE